MSDYARLRVDVQPDGLRVRVPDEPDRVFRWNDIRTIRAYKLDLFTTDLICIAIETDNGIVEISEEDAGYRELADAIEVRYPAAVGFHGRVMLPAFEANETIIFEAT